MAYAHDVFGGDRRNFREIALGEDDQIVDLATISGKEANDLVIESRIVGVIVNDFSIKTTLCISASVYLFDF